MTVSPPGSLRAASFHGNGQVEVTDPTGSLSWTNESAAALTVQCWFKLSVPSSVTLAENMTILVNRSTNNTTSGRHAYHLYYNYANRTVEFTTTGGAGSFQQGIIDQPSMERWYHVAIVRSGSTLHFYVDGRDVTPGGLPSSVGDSRSTGGLSIGGWGGVGNGRHLYGEVQEVSIYRAEIHKEDIVQHLFSDQLTNDPKLKGYFKLGFAQPPADRLLNLANAKTPGTDGYEAPVGVLTYEETSQSGEQSYFDANRNGGEGAVAPVSGVFSWNRTVLSRPTPGVPLQFQIGYFSGNTTARNLGVGWRHSFEMRVLSSEEFSPMQNANVIGLMSWDGGIETWDVVTTGSNVYKTRRGNYRGELALVGANCVWTTPERLVYTFCRPDAGDLLPMRGRLTSIRDPNGNELRLEYDQQSTEAPLKKVIDTAGGEYSFDFDSYHSRLRSVTFQQWTVKFSYDPTNSLRLVSSTVTNTSSLYAPVTNTTWNYVYYDSGLSNNLLKAVVDPMGVTNFTIAYDECGRKTTMANALGYTTRFEYNVPNLRQIRITDAEGFRWVNSYDRSGRVIAKRDPLGNESFTTYDAAGNVTSTLDPLGNHTLLDHDEHGNVIARTNALGEVTRATYDLGLNKPLTQTDPLLWTTTNVFDQAGNLLSQWDAMGLLASHTYTLRGAGSLYSGLPETQTDANGHSTRNLYNAEGFLIAQVDAAGFTNRYVLNELGWRLAAINPLGETTTYTYDVNGKVVRTVDALGRYYRATYDPNGNQLTHLDARGLITQDRYDALNRKILEVDRAGATNWFSYTLRGKPAATTNAVGAVVHYQYDAANRETNSVDALGNHASKVYDPNGNTVATIDPLGQRWTRTYDRLNRKVAESDPFGSTVRTVFDEAGRTAKSIDEKGAVTTFSYDGRGRLTNRVDAIGSSWGYGYDKVGNLTCVADAKGGRYLIAYDSRNKRMAETNQANKEWHYTYDPLGRLNTQTEPDHTVRILEYDLGGRVESVSFTTGRLNRFHYDGNDNPVELSRSDPGKGAVVTYLAYDEMDRVSHCTDPLAQTVHYGYDPAGRLTSVVYPGGKLLNNGYDLLNRLTSQVFHFDTQRRYTNTYAYDAAGRLIRRTYPNGIAQTNTFDSASELTGLTHSALNPQLSTLNVGFNYAYDKNGNPTACREWGTFQWPLPALRDEAADYTSDNQLKYRNITLSPQLTTLSYHYDVNGNMTNAVGTDGQTWSLTYDEDNRTTSIEWDSGLTSRHIDNRYDALGRRFAKTADGNLTGYVLDLAGKMERILCDVDGSLAVTAWYVHGPDLTFKIGPDGTNVSLTCYHPDARGNIVALTGANGNTQVQYAYTPYGRSLGSQPSTTHSQPYLFVGSQGVMEEDGIPGLYFMRARYYLADAGVFLSTDPVQNVGPDWLPIAYAYGNCNPLRWNDPKGEFLNFLLGAVIGAAVDLFTQTVIEHRSIKHLNWGELVASFGTGALTGGAGSIARGLTLGLAKSVGRSFLRGGIEAVIGGLGNSAQEAAQQGGLSGTQFLTAFGWGVASAAGETGLGLGLRGADIATKAGMYKATGIWARAQRVEASEALTEARKLSRYNALRRVARSPAALARGGEAKPLTRLQRAITSTTTWEDMVRVQISPYSEMAWQSGEQLADED